MTENVPENLSAIIHLLLQEFDLLHPNGLRFAGALPHLLANDADFLQRLLGVDDRRVLSCQRRFKIPQKCRSKIPHFGGPAVGRFNDRQLRFSVSADVPCASGAAEA